MFPLISKVKMMKHNYQLPISLLTRTVVEQELSGTRVICEKTMKTPDGKYKVYVSLELAGEEIMNAMANRIKNDDKLRIDFEYEKFKKVFEEEMSKNAQ